MSYTVSYELPAMTEFRQNFVPESDLHGEDRHWLLDYPAGRDLLKVKLLKDSPLEKVSLFGQDARLDAKLDEMIDALGLRALARPVSLVDRLKTEVVLFKLLAKVQFVR